MMQPKPQPGSRMLGARALIGAMPHSGLALVLVALVTVAGALTPWAIQLRNAPPDVNKTLQSLRETEAVHESMGARVEGPARERAVDQYVARMSSIASRLQKQPRESEALSGCTRSLRDELVRYRQSVHNHPDAESVARESTRHHAAMQRIFDAAGGAAGCSHDVGGCCGG